MSKSIINLADMPFLSMPAALGPKGEAAQRYEARMAMVSRAIGARQLGYNVTELPPGKRAFPFHNHRVNEEMFLVLEGHGEVRLGTETLVLRAGDFLACPAGGPDAAHQIVNTGATRLRYLVVSTTITPELVDYPDTGKFGVLAEFPAGPNEPPQVFRFVGRESNAVDYWEGE